MSVVTLERIRFLVCLALNDDVLAQTNLYSTNMNANNHKTSKPVIIIAKLTYLVVPSVQDTGMTDKLFSMSYVFSLVGNECIQD